MRSDLSHVMLRAFHSNKVANRQYVMGIFPDTFDNMPFESQDEHHELIVLDINCKENVQLLVNKVGICIKNTRALFVCVSFQSMFHMQTNFKWVFLNTGCNDQVIIFIFFIL